MKTISAILLAVGLAAPAFADPLTAPIECQDCKVWNQAKLPVHLHGNSYYVGVAGMASVLIVTKDGLILIDGDLPQSAALIEQNIRTLHHDIREVKLILVSHEHFDHVGGVAALQWDSGARVLAGAAAAKALGLGHPTEADPQYDPSGKYSYPEVNRVDTVEDGQQISLGEVTVTAHRTPGHTPGGTSYSWKSCEPGKCLDIVYADSLTALATSDDFRFAPIADTFRASIDKIRNLPCDILVTTHPGVSDFWARNDKHTFVDPNACRALADRSEAALDKRLAEERK